jgi:hypothetical protein
VGNLHSPVIRDATLLDKSKSFQTIHIQIMRIHLSLDPKHLVQPAAGPSSGPLVNIGGDLVLVELQGELNHEGDKANGVVGILGLDRPVSHLTPNMIGAMTDKEG